jgi:flagellar motor switch protein FliM
MSNQALSQDEIDALFTGDPEPQPTPERSEPEARLYDFRRPSRVSKDRQRTLEGMYGALAKALEGWLVGRVRSQVDVHLKAVEQLTFGEFVLSLPEPCSSFVFNIGEPGGPQAVIDLGREFAFYAIERFLGSASATTVPERPLTVLERRVVRIIAERLAGQLRDTWADHATLDLELARFEAVPDMLQAANREDSMLVANLETRFQGRTGSILICLPFTVLDDFFAAATSGGVRPAKRAGVAPEERDAIASSVRRANVPIAVRLAPFELTFQEVTELRPGGTLITGIPRSAPVQVQIGGLTRYTGLVGTAGDVLAVQLMDEVETDEEVK